LEERKNNEVESLAAFLHSGSELSAPQKNSVPEKSGIKKTPETEISNDRHKEIDELLIKSEENIKSNKIKNVPYKEFTETRLAKQDVNKEDKEKSLNDILFSIDSKKRQKNEAPAVVYEPEEPDETVVYGEEEEEDASVYEPSSSDYEEYDNNGVHYDDAATQMMNAVRPVQSKSEEYPEEYEEDEETPEEKEERREIARMKLSYEKQRQHTRTFASILIGALLCAGIIGVSAYLSQYIITFALDLTGIVTNDFRMDVEIPEGADTELVAAILHENNIISSPKFFAWFGDITGKGDEYVSDTYTLSSTMTYMTLYSTLQKGNWHEKTVSIRIVEGMTAREIGELLEENCVCFAEDFEKYYTNIQNDHDFEKRLRESSLKYHQLEGYLFPDTYEFYVVQAMEDKSLHGGTSDEALEMYKNSANNAEEAADKNYGNFDDKITRTMYKQMGEMNMTLDEVITLASMVQKEAASAEDMYYVASVFLNRIRNSESFPKLESDVTILYVENEIKPFETSGSLKYKRYADAYNTYTCNGIPAGPVCNPGLDAIDAVLNAAETNYFFFCANEDTGEVFYAETKEQHEENLILAELKPAE